MIRLLLCLSLLPCLALARTAHPPAPAAPPPPLTPAAMCDAAVGAAEARSRLPSRVLTAIALHESGRIDPDTGRWRPWPWTINFEGTGHFYASKEEAIAAVQQIQASGGQSIDVGCMQINLMHHPNAFTTLDDAFDPTLNAIYAGRFLKDLFTSMGDWGQAIAAYHSRTPGLGEPYRDQVVAAWNPKDPAVLAKLSFQPLPAGGAPISGLPMIYAPFARPGPVQISANMAYRAFLPSSNVYGAFRSSAATYGDFSSKPVKPARGRPLDLRLSDSLAGSGRALVLPTGVVERGSVKGAVLKQSPKRSGDTG